MLIPAYGVFGAALATIISLFISSVLLNFCLKQSRQVSVSFFRSLLLLDLCYMILIFKNLIGKTKNDKV